MKKTINNNDLENALQGKTNEEAAKSLNISVRTLFRLKKNLLKEVEEVKPIVEKPVKKVLTKEDLRYREDEELKDRMIRLYPEKFKKAFEDRAAKIQKERFTPEIKQQENVYINSPSHIEDVSHFVISDMQVGPNVNVSHLQYIVKEILERLPNVIIFMGDFFDITSLFNVQHINEFDSFQYQADLKAGNHALSIIMQPIVDEMKKGQWKPRIVATLGNHENRIVKFSEENKSSKAIGAFMGINNLDFEKYGIEVYPFLQPVIIDDIVYCHYFTNGNANKTFSNAQALVKKKMMNCVMGHVQHFDMHREVKADGTPIWGIFTGASYIHDEIWCGPQGNHYARIVWAFNDVRGKTFNPEPIHITNLIKKYTKKRENKNG